MWFKALFSGKRKEDLFNLHPDAYIVLESSGIILDVNARATELFNSIRLSMIGHSISEYIEGGSNILKEAVEENKAVIAKIITPSETDKYAEITALRDDIKGNLYISLRNVTENYTKQEAQKGAFKEVKSIVNEKNKYLDANSEEILSLIASNMGFSKALLDGISGKLDPKQEKYIKIINKNAKDVLYNLEKVFQLCKLESGLWRYDLRTFDVVNLLNEIATKWEKIFKAKKIRFSYDFSGILLRNCYLDPMVLSDILNSILEISYRTTDIGSCSFNAGSAPVEFLKSKGFKIRESEMGDTVSRYYVMVEIRDTSSAIVAEELDNIFNPYAIIKNPQRRSMGCKLSYAIVKKFLQYFGGDIWIYSKASQGTMAAFVIPVEKEV